MGPCLRLQGLASILHFPLCPRPSGLLTLLLHPTSRCPGRLRAQHLLAYPPPPHVTPMSSTSLLTLTTMMWLRPPPDRVTTRCKALYAPAPSNPMTRLFPGREPNTIVTTPTIRLAPIRRRPLSSAGNCRSSERLIRCGVRFPGSAQACPFIRLLLKFVVISLFNGPTQPIVRCPICLHPPRPVGYHPHSRSLCHYHRIPPVTGSPANLCNHHQKILRLLTQVDQRSFLLSRCCIVCPVPFRLRPNYPSWPLPWAPAHCRLRRGDRVQKWLQVPLQQT